MDSVFLNWARGNRLSLHTGLKAIPDGYRYSNDYIALYVPVAEAEPLGNKEIEDNTVKANTRVRFRAAVEVNPRKYRVAVDVNPVLFQYGDVTYSHYLEIGSGDQPHIYVSFRRQFDLSELDYLVRLYLVA